MALVFSDETGYFVMILYFSSGRCTKDSTPEMVSKEINIMMSFYYIRIQDQKRFERVLEKRREKQK